ncbi:hypothetical protein JNB88_03085, partial [Rhizobium cauense]|uniref:hypothetical protein n=1 Tax=Rhizobium cauense TaxID=1166683 RepID=UPI001C6E6A7E
MSAGRARPATGGNQNLGALMRLFVVVSVTAIALTSGAAEAYQKCGGSPAVDVYWERSVISVNGTFFQMKSEKLGKRSTRLVGHGMVFVRSKGGNTLIRNGGSTRYTCQKAEGDLPNASVIPYSANKVIKSTAPADFADDNGSGAQSSSG